MADTKFPIRGTTIPPMLGRAIIIDRMMSALTKATPDHLQMVGPRFAGKTVILHELATRLRQAGSPYSAVVQWDLGHQTPATDELFMQRFAHELSSALQTNHTDYAKHLKTLKGNCYHDIAEILDLIKEEKKKVLAIMDGFDKPLSNGKLTRNLWDQLRELALKPSLRLVAASRLTLRDLIRHPDAQTSDFWNIFDPSPVRVGCFNENDMSSILAAEQNHQFEQGAQTELWNSSNGFPVLILGVLNAIKEMGKGKVTAEMVRVAAQNAFPVLHDELDTLWSDCSPSSQDLLKRVLEEKEVSRSGIANVDIEKLIERGFIHTASNRLYRPSRLLQIYLEQEPHEGNSLVRLFGTADAYHKNLKSVLERRINQIDGIDEDLKRYLVRGVDDLPAHPKVFLSNVHGILEQALSQIWSAECWNATSNKPQIPSEWFSIWERNEEKDKRIDDWKTRFPEGGARLRLLDLMTGSQNTDRLASFITKNTYVLANSVQGFRDFGVHPKATEVDIGTAYAALHACIELAASVTRELLNRESQGGVN